MELLKKLMSMLGLGGASTEAPTQAAPQSSMPQEPAQPQA